MVTKKCCKCTQSKTVDIKNADGGAASIDGRLSMRIRMCTELITMDKTKLNETDFILSVVRVLRFLSRQVIVWERESVVSRVQTWWRRTWAMGHAMTNTGWACLCR